MSKAYRRTGSAERSIKVTVSLPAALLRAADASGRSTGRTRSAVFQEALRLWLAGNEQALLVREYQAGYGRAPEESVEIEAAQAAAIALLSKEEW